ncbi:MAG: hypothetical protein K0R77_2893 [Chryseobacterium sp.]|jgi:hypothetical protein|nr:hypothetical protein [Chryseobacterium sp.]
MQNGTVDVPDSVAGSINEVINDSKVNSGDYNDKGFNCFLCAINVGNVSKLVMNIFERLTH